jgi:hypothetical protein
MPDFPGSKKEEAGSEKAQSFSEKAPAGIGA